MCGYEGVYASDTSDDFNGLCAGIRISSQQPNTSNIIIAQFFHFYTFEKVFVSIYVRKTIEDFNLFGVCVF